MAGMEGSFIPEEDYFQIGTSWFPITPVKPGLSSIYGNGQQNQPTGQVNEVESLGISQGQDLSNVKQIELRHFMQEPHAQSVAACCGSANSAAVTGYFDAWESAAGIESKMYEDNNIKMCSNMPTDDVDEWSNVSFGHLLALAHAAGGSTVTTENANVETNFTLNGSFNSLVSLQDAGKELKYSLTRHHGIIEMHNTCRNFKVTRVTFLVYVISVFNVAQWLSLDG